METILFMAKRREGRFAAAADATDGLAVDLRPRGRTGCRRRGRRSRSFGARASMWRRVDSGRRQVFGLVDVAPMGAALPVASRIAFDPVPVTGSSPHTAAGQRRN